MSKLITVHGTYAHLDLPDEQDGTPGSYWWHPGSAFIKEVKAHASSEDGEIEVVPFVWSGENSEVGRRESGRVLFEELERLEAEGETYCVVAHSHGGSVVSAALLEAAARKQQLPGLKRWITIGTPFTELQRERFLFMRLPIILKAMYVASLMLLIMFLMTLAGRFFDGDLADARPIHYWRMAFGAFLAAMPFIVFSVVVGIRERIKLYFYRPSVKKRAREWFGWRWLALTHEDDEAVRGLGSLRNVKISIFHRDFAVPWLSLASVFVLPIAYLLAVTSPALMSGLGEMLRKDVYQLDQFEARRSAYEDTRKVLRSYRRELRDARKIADDTLRPLHEREAAEKKIREARAALREERRRLHSAYPDLPNLQRALRFRRKFLEKDGQLCNGGRLCGDGHHWPTNARLLFHLVTDEASSLFFDDEVLRGAVGRVGRFLVPIVLAIILVPVVFGSIAVLLVLIVQVLAKGFSRLASGWLDDMTWREIRRSALGNDTEDEVAIGSAPFPKWMGDARPFLPAELGGKITDRSNEATFRSLSKFRNAISELTLLEASSSETDKLLAYLTWNELIHMAYFQVPEFAQLVAGALARSDGFAKGAEAPANGGGQVEEWLRQLEGVARADPATAGAG